MRLFHYDGNWRNKWLLLFSFFSLFFGHFNILASFAAHFFYFISPSHIYTTQFPHDAVILQPEKKEAAAVEKCV